MQKAEGARFFRRQRTPVIPRPLEQVERADHVGGDEGRGAIDGAVDVAFRCEIDDGVRLMVGQQPLHQGAVADVAVNEPVSPVSSQRRQGFQVARVGQCIQVDDGARGILPQRSKHEIPADKSGAAGDQPRGHSAVLVNSPMRES